VWTALRGEAGAILRKPVGDRTASADVRARAAAVLLAGEADEQRAVALECAVALFGAGLDPDRVAAFALGDAQAIDLQSVVLDEGLSGDVRAKALRASGSLELFERVLGFDCDPLASLALVELIRRRRADRDRSLAIAARLSAPSYKSVYGDIAAVFGTNYAADHWVKFGLPREDAKARENSTCTRCILRSSFQRSAAADHCLQYGLRVEGRRGSASFGTI
jgi:hypothetical protein